MLTGRQIVSHGIVHPAPEAKVDNGVEPSYGPDGCGYTFRCDYTGGEVRQILRGGESITLRTLETVSMPIDCCGILFIKSTYARKGLVLVTNSPVEPDYVGKLTMRLVNTTGEPIVIWMEGGFVQMMVDRLEEDGNSYNGRWQGGS